MSHTSGRRSKTVLFAALAIVVVTLGFGGGVLPHLSGGGFDASGTESAATSAGLQADFGVADSDAVFLVGAREGSVDDEPVRRAGRDLASEIGDERQVSSVVAYWDAPYVPGLRSEDGTRAIVLVNLTGSQNEKSDWLRDMHDRYDGGGPAADVVSVEIGGNAEVFRAIQDQVMADLLVSEAIAVPICLILLLFVFRSVMAALLPLAIGLLSTAVTLATLRLLSMFTEVSIFSLNLTTALALGLGIDYGLLMVTRFREEMAHGRTTEDAVSRTMRTAGRTVLYSGLTVAMALGTLLLFPLAFLRSFGYAAVPAVLVAMLGAVVVLPEMLRLLGSRVDKWSLHRLPSLSPSEEFWERTTRWTIRHRVVVAAIGVTGLALVALPFLHVQIGKSDDRVLHAGASVRDVQEVIREDFIGNVAFPVTVHLPGAGESGPATAAADTVAAEISELPQFSLVSGGSGMWQGGALVSPQPALAESMTEGRSAYLVALLRPDVEVYSGEAADAVTTIRAFVDGTEATVGGESARLVDNKDVIGDILPLALGLIVLATLVMVFLLTRSVLVPLKAVFLNLLSLSATFGVMVWGFQDGNLAGLLGFTPTGYLDNAMPVLMFCAAFGLSMDYELFLVSRIREEYLRTGDNDVAVINGIKKTGAVFTSAALLLAVVFAGLVASKVSIIQMAGLGIVLAILLDATVIRSFLVPALMSLMGRANWWAPSFLRRAHDRIGLSEGPVADEDVPAPSRPAVEAARG